MIRHLGLGLVAALALASPAHAQGIGFSVGVGIGIHPYPAPFHGGYGYGPPPVVYRPVVSQPTYYYQPPVVVHPGYAPAYVVPRRHLYRAERMGRSAQCRTQHVVRWSHHFGGYVTQPVTRCF